MVQVSLDMTIVATTIPKITDEFKSQDFVAWIGAAFFLTIAAFQSSKPFPFYMVLIMTNYFKLGARLSNTSTSKQRTLSLFLSSNWAASSAVSLQTAQR
jgi:hypothetical protein